MDKIRLQAVMKSHNLFIYLFITRVIDLKIYVKRLCEYLKANQEIKVIHQKLKQLIKIFTTFTTTQDIHKKSRYAQFINV